MRRTHGRDAIGEASTVVVRSDLRSRACGWGNIAGLGNAMQQHVKVAELYKADLVTSDGKEASMFLAELGPGANMGSTTTPGMPSPTSWRVRCCGASARARKRSALSARRPLKLNPGPGRQTVGVGTGVPPRGRGAAPPRTDRGGPQWTGLPEDHGAYCAPSVTPHSCTPGADPPRALPRSARCVVSRLPSGSRGARDSGDR